MEVPSEIGVCILAENIHVCFQHVSRTRGRDLVKLRISICLGEYVGVEYRGSVIKGLLLYWFTMRMLMEAKNRA